MLPVVVSDFKILVVEADHSDVRSNDHSVVHTHNILCENVCSPVLVDGNLWLWVEYPYSIWVLVLVDLVPEVV